MWMVLKNNLNTKDTFKKIQATSTDIFHFSWGTDTDIPVTRTKYNNNTNMAIFRKPQ